MRFSRRTLNSIMLACLAIISWIHLGQTDPELEPLAPLTLPPLPPAHWQHWQAQEGIHVYWQQLSQNPGTVRILPAHHRLSDMKLDAQRWSEQLKQLTPNTSTIQPTRAIVLQGSWSQSQIQIISAYLIQQFRLVADNHDQPVSHSTCAQQFAAGSLWFRDQWFMTTPDLTKALPSRQQWQQFRQQHSRELRQRWLSHSGQLDIQTDIAYHRSPAGYYQRLYQQLGNRQKTAAQAYLNCQTNGTLQQAD